VLRISSGLRRKFGLERNARVGLLGDASAEWLLTDIALMRCGVNIVCLAASAKSSEGTEHSFRDLELLICSVDWLEHLVDARQLAEAPGCPIVTLRPVLPRLAAQAHHNGFEICDLEFVAQLGEVEGWVPCLGVGGWEVFTTMYRSRSGTRSELAGVSVSLQGLTVAAHSVAEALGFNCNDVHFSYSWPAFAAERVVLHAMLASGGAVGFFGGNRSPRIFEDIKRLRPTFLLGSPSLFRRQITRLRHKHIGLLGRLCFEIHRWALRRRRASEILEASPASGPAVQPRGLADRLARRCLEEPWLTWLMRPFVRTRAVLIGPKTQLRFVLTLCTAGSTALPPGRCLWMRLIFGCPVLKGFVAVEGGGLVTLGEAPYFGETAADAFYVGRVLPGVKIELLPLKLPIEMPLSILRSDEAGVQHGTLRIRGVMNDSDTRVGLICGRRGRDLFVFGRLVSLEASRKGPALCEALEQLLVQLSGSWLMQLLLTARRGKGVVGIAAVRIEELHFLMRYHSLDVRSGDDPCKDPHVREICLWELQRCATAYGFTEAELPRALHLEATPFSFEAGLQTPTFQLRRDQLLPRYATTVEKLFEEVDDVQTADVSLDSLSDTDAPEEPVKKASSTGFEGGVTSPGSPLALPPRHLSDSSLSPRHAQALWGYIRGLSFGGHPSAPTRRDLESFPSGEWG